MQVPSEQAHSQSSLLESKLAGPRVVRLYGAVIAVLWVAAWWSWGIQAQDLVGRHGLLPLAESFAKGQGRAVAPMLRSQSLFSLAPNDWAILLALALGIVSATLAAFDIAPKRALFLSLLLYVSFVAPAAPFMPMLPDRLLLEATVLMFVLPRNRTAQGAQWLARGLIFKLYCEIGLAQWLAPDHGWKNGLALRDFLQTTPLPTLPGFWVAHLPDPALALLTKSVVLVLLIVPWLVFGPRPARLVAALMLTSLQIVVCILCNYGLFCWLAVALHLFLLADADVARVQNDIHRLSPKFAAFFASITSAWQAWQPWGALAPIVLRLKNRHPTAAPALHRGLRGTAAMVVCTAYVLGSLMALSPKVGAWQPPQAIAAPWARLAAFFAPWHLMDGYTSLHAPSAPRTEPVLEALVNNEWQPIYLWHQPSDPWAKPKFVAPHTPRLAILMSSFGRSQSFEVMPHFVGRLLETLCDEPQALGKLFATPLPKHPQAIRISLWHYTFAPWATLRDRGAYWERDKLMDGPHLVCRNKQP